MSQATPDAERPERPDRRHFLRGSLGAAAAATWMSSCGGSASSPPGGADAAPAGLPDDLEPADFLVHGENPLILEGRREHQRGLVTPTDKVFVRGNLPLPPASIVANANAWELEIAGVANPGSMTLADLRRFAPVTVAAVLQCSGNGRKFFEHGPSGSPWGVGAAANVLWTGARLGDVVDAMGGPSGAGLRFATGLGGEQIPEELGAEYRIERSVPLDKAMEDGILAWQLNGEPLTLAHGGPLRLVIPGFYGVNHVKFLRRLALTADESDAKIQAKSYRVRPVGKKGAPGQPSMYAMNVKSWITSPLEGGRAGRYQVTGVAFSGEAPIDSVEVTVDGGATWGRAELVGPDLGPYAWRTFACSWDATPGTHVLASRATDGTGAAQPEDVQPNERGYAHNGWRDPAVTVEIA